MFSTRSESPDDRASIIAHINQLTTSVLECAPGKRPDAVALGLLSNTQVYTMDGSRMDCLMLAHEASRHMLAQNPSVEDWGRKDMSGFRMRLADATVFIKDTLYERARDAGSASAAAASSRHQLPVSDAVEQLPNIDAALLADFGVPSLEVLDDIRASALAPAPGDGMTDRQVNDALAARTLPLEALGVMAAFTESTPAVVMTLETLSGGFSAVRVGVFTAGEALVQGQPLCSPSLVAWSGGHANVAVPLPDGDLTIFIDDPAHLMPEVQKSSHRQLGMAFRMEHLPAHMRAMLVEVDVPTAVNTGIVQRLQPVPSGLAADAGIRLPPSAYMAPVEPSSPASTSGLTRGYKTVPRPAGPALHVAGEATGLPTRNSYGVLADEAVMARLEAPANGSTGGRLAGVGKRRHSPEGCPPPGPTSDVVRTKAPRPGAGQGVAGAGTGVARGRDAMASAGQGVAGAGTGVARGRDAMATAGQGVAGAGTGVVRGMDAMATAGQGVAGAGTGVARGRDAIAAGGMSTDARSTGRQLSAISPVPVRQCLQRGGAPGPLDLVDVESPEATGGAVLGVGPASQESVQYVGEVDTGFVVTAVRPGDMGGQRTLARQSMDVIEIDTVSDGASDDDADIEQGELPAQFLNDEARVAEWALGNALLRYGDMQKEVVEAADAEDAAGRSHMRDADKEWDAVAFATQTFAGTTAARMGMKRRDYEFYCEAIECPVAVSDIDKLEWPPVRQVWLDFLVKAREHVSSYRRFKCLLSNVCVTANTYFQRERKCQKEEVDPRILYCRDTKQVCNQLKRDGGVGVRQVMGITMQEAWSGPNFCDPDSIRECTMALAWTLGTICGGRRPRSVAAIRLKDITLKACSVEIRGQTGVSGDTYIIPAIACLKWTDEKTPNYSGDRESSDVYDDDIYQDWSFLRVRPSYWAYRLLVMRGLFAVHPDPLSIDGMDALRKAGIDPFAQLPVKDGAFDHFLLCESLADQWNDALPLSVGILGQYTMTLLERMGCPPRRYSAHRRGCVTRACMLDIIRNRGERLSRDTISAICRLGGWECVTGVMTVLKVYAAAVIDRFVCGASLTLGQERVDEEEVWRRRRARLLGKPLVPQRRIRDSMPVAGPLGLRHCIRFDPAVLALREQITDATRQLLSIAREDRNEVPIARFREMREVYSRIMQRPVHKIGNVELRAAVEHLKALLAQRDRLLFSVTPRVMAQLRVMFLGMFPKMSGVPRLMVAEYVRGVVIGREPWGCQGLQPQSMWSRGHATVSLADVNFVEG
ncbi:hypothetical protein PLESTB_000069100 [Pleodorina starrii]|uniref:Uncharacterized protein n=1 Tax=Pleodorina starrii TaxID=330485 RepID=A0A9W6B9T7_9CHLO|nr:hypothetical protein PLESTM_001604200 [Pleodorina starrii]GLC48191.1 hypothetical protein PLESTB_000069100 [Pleodorina starrii]GLC67436.1 hypothetical protein PLESTF_000556000 [Pleodorina starrii]